MRPVLVAGPERSGTSLMYALLASHPNLAMTRRTNMWTYFGDQFGDLADPANLSACLDLMFRYKRLVKLDLDRHRLEQDFWNGPPTYGHLFEQVGRQVAEREGKPRWGDKSLATERYADPIFEAWPDAKIIHMLRDPRDRYASVIKRWKRRRGGVGAGVAEWNLSAERAIGNRDDHARYLVVRYEDLAAEPEAVMRTVCDFIGEPFIPSMLDMHGAPEFRDRGANSSYGSRTAGKISTSSIGRFTEVLEPSSIEFIQRRASDGMREFGYPHHPVGRLSLRDRADLVDQSIRFHGWRMRDAWRDRRGRRLPDYRIVGEDDR